METEIYKQFRESGYQDVKVTGPLRSIPSPEEIVYTFSVIPGPEYKITEVQIEGLSFLKKNDALEAMGLFPSFGNPPLLTEQNIRLAIDSLSSTYSDNGFWDVKVYYPKVKKSLRRPNYLLASQKAKDGFSIALSFEGIGHTPNLKSRIY